MVTPEPVPTTIAGALALLTDDELRALLDSERPEEDENTPGFLRWCWTLWHWLRAEQQRRGGLPALPLPEHPEAVLLKETLAMSDAELRRLYTRYRLAFTAHRTPGPLGLAGILTILCEIEITTREGHRPALN